MRIMRKRKAFRTALSLRVKLSFGDRVEGRGHRVEGSGGLMKIGFGGTA